MATLNLFKISSKCEIGVKFQNLNAKLMSFIRVPPCIALAGQAVTTKVQFLIALKPSSTQRCTRLALNYLSGILQSKERHAADWLEKVSPISPDSLLQRSQMVILPQKNILVYGTSCCVCPQVETQTLCMHWASGSIRWGNGWTNPCSHICYSARCWEGGEA